MLLEDGAPLIDETVGGTETGVDGQANPASEDLQVIEETITELDKALKDIQEAVERLRESIGGDPK